MLIIPLPTHKRRRAQFGAPPAPINRIASVTVQSDRVTIDIHFTPGTVVTGMDEPSDDFFVNYSGGQTNGNSATVVTPTQLRIVLVDVIDSPATWEVDGDDPFQFSTGTFAGPNGGDVVFA